MACYATYFSVQNVCFTPNPTGLSPVESEMFYRNLSESVATPLSTDQISTLQERIFAIQSARETLGNLTALAEDASDGVVEGTTPLPKAISTVSGQAHEADFLGTVLGTRPRFEESKWSQLPARYRCETVSL